MFVSLTATAHFVGILTASLCFLSTARGAISDRDINAPHPGPSVQATALHSTRGVKRPSSTYAVSTADDSAISNERTSSAMEIMACAIMARKRARLSVDDYQYQCCLGMARVLIKSEPADMLNHYISLFIDGRAQRPASTNTSLLRATAVLLLVHGKGDILVNLLGRRAFTALDPQSVRQFIMLAAEHQRVAAIVTWLPRILTDTRIDAAEAYSSVATSIQSGSEALRIVLALWAAASQQAQVPSSDVDAAYYHLVQLTATIKSARLPHLQYQRAIESPPLHTPTTTAADSGLNIIYAEIDCLYKSLTDSQSLLSYHVTQPFYLFPIQITGIYMLRLIPLEQLPAVADYVLRRKYAPLMAQASRPMIYKLLVVTALIVNRWLDRSAPHSAVFSKLLQLFRRQAHINLLCFITQYVSDMYKIVAVWQRTPLNHYKILYGSNFRTQNTWHDLNAAILQRIAAQRFKMTSCPSMLWICTAPYLAMVQQRLIEVNCAADAPPSDEEVVNCDDSINKKIAAVWLLELQHLHALYIQEANFAARFRHPVLAPSSAQVENGRGNYELSLIPRLFALSNVMAARRTSRYIAAHLAAHPRTWTVLPCIWYAINSMQAFSMALPAPCSLKSLFCKTLLGDEPERYCRARALRSLSNFIISIPEVAADMHDTDDPVIAAIGHAELVPLLQSRPHALQFVYYLHFFLQWPCPASLSTSIDWSQLYHTLTQALACLADEYSSACGPCRVVQKWLDVCFAPYGTPSKPDALFGKRCLKLCSLQYLSFYELLALSPPKAAETSMPDAQKSASGRTCVADSPMSKSPVAEACPETPMFLLTDHLANSLPVLSPALLQDPLEETHMSAPSEESPGLSVSPDPPQDFSVFEFSNLDSLNRACGLIYD